MSEKRFTPDNRTGLTEQQVQSRISSGLINYDVSLPTKSTKKIILENTVTLFNIINVALAVAVIAVGSFKNMLFMGIVLCNTCIGIFQELRAKRAVDKLSIIGNTKITAIRGGENKEIGIHDIVLDDIIKLHAGNQIPCDCVVTDGECDVNESLITGESDNIHKAVGDELLSGSYIVCGNVFAKAERIAENCYASTIFKDSKYIKKPNSQIMKTLNRIILVLSIAIVPVGLLLFFAQYNIAGNTIYDTIVTSVAAIIGMIPEGLVLLVSTVLAVSVIRLSKRKVLVQELYCIETLARVDMLCLDKTGTITEGTLELSGILPQNGYSEEKIGKALSNIVNVLQDNNATSDAIKEKFNFEVNENITAKCPFTSDRKYSGISIDNKSYIMGAAEYILPDDLMKEFENATAEIPDGTRILTLVEGNGIMDNCKLPSDLKLMAVITIKDKIRSNAKETLNYFKEQGVEIKVISGDNAKTVSAIARTVELDGWDNYVDLSKIKDDKEIYNIAKKYTIFGRVTPDKKKMLIQALKADGHIVGMTGDGVNDVPALKESDCSIAMASGSDAARNTAQLVLTDNDFSAMPHVVEEGRRTINNIQRSASLFLMKTIFSSLLAIVFVFLHYQYPFQPIQMTLISAFTIGIPSFILALEPNKDRIKGSFFLNVISKALPGALTVVFGVIISAVLGGIFELKDGQTSLLSLSVTAFTGLMLVYMVSRPLNAIRRTLIIVMGVCIATGAICFAPFFSLSALSIKLVFMIAFLFVYAFLMYTAFHRIGEEIALWKNKRRMLNQI